MNPDFDKLILVGFGKTDLKDMLSDLDDPVKAEELLSAFTKSPPRYRPMRACDKEELAACVFYYEWLKKQILDYEKSNGEEEKN